MRKVVLSLVSVFVLSMSVVAQDTLETSILHEVVVSASRTEQPVIDIPRSVTVITSETIRNSVYQSLGDLLNAQSGLYVVGAQQTPGMNQNVFMRGANSNQVAVLIDGVRVTDPSSPNAAVDLSEISLAHIERVEVIRGSHSTMYGGAAIGGVINLITKKGSSAGFHGDAWWQGGVFGKDNALVSKEGTNLSYGFGNGLYLKGSFFRADTEGVNAVVLTEDNPSFSADRDGFEKTDGSIGVGFKHAVWDADVTFKRSHQYTEVDNGAFSDDDNYYLLFDRNLLQYNVGYTIDRAWRLSLLGSFSDSERYYENDSSRIGETEWDKAYSSGSYFGNLQTHEAQVNYEARDFSAVFGAGLYRETMSFESYFFYNDPAFPYESTTNYDTLDTRTTTGYVFTQASRTFGNFRFSAGARLSRHTLAGNFLTFEVNPSYTIGDMLLYGSLSTGYNAPSLYQLFDPSKNFGAYTTRGNRALEPERSLSVEGGVKKEFHSGSFLTLSAYHTRVDNAIEYVYLWEGSRPLDEITFADDRGDTYINAGTQQTSGVELDGYAQITDAFSFKGNISVLQTRVDVAPEDADVHHTGGHHVQLYNLGTFLDREVTQEHAVRRPDFTAFARLGFRPVEDLRVSLGYRYTGKRFDSGYDGSLGPYGALGRLEVEGYHLLDIGAYWQATKLLAVAVNVENVLNEDYREVVGFTARGRGAYLKVIARW